MENKHPGNTYNNSYHNQYIGCYIGGPIINICWQPCSMLLWGNTLTDSHHLCEANIVLPKYEGIKPLLCRAEAIKTHSRSRKAIHERDVFR